MREPKKKGGARPGAGRPSKDKIRTNRTLRLYDDEWEIVKEFAAKLKADRDKKD